MIISVASGKGGTGKTLVSTSLAISLKALYNTQLLDCDVEEPDVHIFLKPVIQSSSIVSIPVPQVDENKCTYCGRCARWCQFGAISVIGGKHINLFPQLCHACGTCTYLCPQKALTEVPHSCGRVDSGNAGNLSFVAGTLDIGSNQTIPLIHKVKAMATDNNVVIIDCPPGTSCPAFESIHGSDYCLLVSEPTPFGLNDLKLAVETVRKLDIPFGLILNRTGNVFTPMDEYCRAENISILMSIPYDAKIASLYSKGLVLAEEDPNWLKEFQTLFTNIRGQLGKRNRYPEW
ncbi:(4Fe-4S)-binding protein [Dehalococcoides mccartyi]|uniref:ATP-binding protein n=1 Tax=Dehalococcoides TaxID=61434 RepID=UPI00062D3F37|nr:MULTISPECIES: ATP-binding protein [Dehalococcoides]APH13069.1 (4Fe-4S)-binding protein [Dehalococcoides mccartyi]QYY58781.1 ATP-binding protein [Dehalococcoides mccartyi]